MLKRLRWFLGRNLSAKRLTQSHGRQQQVQQLLKQLSPPTEPVAAEIPVDLVQEVSVYINRFHNLDLFHQGWYQVKITVYWENGEDGLPGTPARVVQYEAPDLGSEDMFRGWRIDDAENSFLTQPFRIRYARQDVDLCIMISFDLSLSIKDLHTSAVILKFELLYAPLSKTGAELLGALEACPDAVHRFRIPPKALVGLHSYCPVYFDAFHAVLMDTTIHTGIKVGSGISRVKVSSDGAVDKVTGGEAAQNQSLLVTYRALSQVASLDSKELMLLKALIASHDILVEELQQVTNAIGRTTELTDLTLKLGYMETCAATQHMNYGNAEDDRMQLSAKIQKDPEVADGAHILEQLSSLSQAELSNLVDLVGRQISYLWTIFLKFHRDNKKRILEYLYNAWANNRRAEWSIWMACSKIEISQHCLNGAVDESYLSGHEGALTLRKLTSDPSQKAATRAELHRQSVAQMRINHRSIQDMQLYGNPLHIPIVFVELVTIMPNGTGNTDISILKQRDTSCSASINDLRVAKRFPEAIPQWDERVLKVVVFVHGFQGHHLDLRLVRNQWLLIDPKTEILMSEVNEDKTSEDFREMGLRLAQEVIGFVKKKMDKASRSAHLRDIKISFVGHSIGNIIIRAALAESILEPYLRYLHTFVSISGPHLGYLYSSNSLFNSGLWILKKLKGTQCIHQLTFSDDSELENTFFYKLCKKTFEDFKNVILLSSPQDGYVPYHSARIQMCQAALADHSRKGKVFFDMLNNCLNQIQAASSYQRVFIRCDVNFNISSSGKNLNTYIGRAAHIEFLESDNFVRFIMWSYPELFR